MNRTALSLFAFAALVGCNGPAASTDAGNDAYTPPADDGGSDAFVTASDAGGDCHDDYSGCTTLEDHTGVSTFAISATSSFTYDHHCVRVSVGTVVTMTNSITHPLTAASCSTAGGPIPNPAVPASGTATTTDYTFTTPGHYGYFCENHGADDGAQPAMAGLIVVE